MKLSKVKNKGWFTLVEMIIVVSLIIILIYALYPKFAGYISKQKDLTRIKVSQEVSTYYEGIMQAIGSYPNWNLKNASSWLRKFAKAVSSNTFWGWGSYFVEFLFEGDRDAAGYFQSTWDSKLKEFQEMLVQSWILGSPNDIKTLQEGENMFVFTSKTWKRMVSCVKLYGENETARTDWDWILDDQDPDSADGHKNGSRIYVQWDMKLWEQLWNAAKDKCRDDLVDPRSL